MSQQNRQFVYNTLVDRENLCNLAREAETLLSALRTSDKVVIYGKRDSGKTSLIKNVVIPDFLRETPKGMAIYAEFYGVKSLEDVAEKLTLYVNKAYQSAFSLKATLKSTAKMLTGLRPTLSLSQDGSVEASLKAGRDDHAPMVQNFFETVASLSRDGVQVAIIFDEFQDIALAPGAEAILREEMQKLPFAIPVIILGSKQHLLAKIFQRPKAPFFNWGKRVEMPALPIEEYNTYIAERLRDHDIIADPDTLTGLQAELGRNPEAINMFCSYLIQRLGRQKPPRASLTPLVMATLLKDYVEAMGSEFEAYLDGYTKNEVKVMTLIAKKGVLVNPLGKEPLAQLKLSASGMRKILAKLLDHADVYRENAGYVLSKPLLMHYLRDWRL